MRTTIYLTVILGAVGLSTAVRCGPAGADEDEFAAFREEERKAFAEFAAMEQGARRDWVRRDRELARTWAEERQALLKAFGAVEKAAGGDPLKTVRTESSEENQIAQSQVDFAAGKVEIEVVVVAASEEEAQQQAEELARQKLQEAALQVPAAGGQTLQEQGQQIETVAQQQEQALQMTYDEKEKVSAELPDGRVEAKVVLEQPLTGKNGLTAMALAAVVEESEEKPVPPPTQSAEEIVREQGPFTGLLLDASSASGAKPSLVPTVRAADGSVVYGPAKVDKVKAIHGMADWLRSGADAKGNERLGDNPLKVEVAEVQRGGRLLISDEDAALIRAADGGFLADCQVAVLLGK